MNPAFDLDTGAGGSTGERAAGKEARSNMLLIYILTAVVIFLIAMIAVIMIAKSLRPVVRNQDTLPKAVTLEDWVERLCRAPDEKTRQEAARKIVSMGPDAVLTTLDLVTMASDDAIDISPKVLRVLAGMGPPIIEPLRRGLVSPKPNVRAGAARILREMGPEARGAVDSLVIALSDENRWVRWYAIEALGNLGSGGAPGVDPLVKLLSHEDYGTRQRAATALGQIGPAAKAAAPALKRLSNNDRHRSVRTEAAKALAQVDLDAIAHESARRASGKVRELIEQLRDGDEHEAASAAKRLGDMGYNAKESIPALTQALSHNNKWVREAAADALGDMGRRADSALPALKRLSNDEPEVRLAAEKAIDKIEGH